MNNWQLFVRHAHRDLLDRDLDNGLSAKGHAQGRAIVEYLSKNHPERKPRQVYSSAKRRCLETAQFVADWAGVSVREDPRLMEQTQEKETSSEFLARMESLAREARHMPETCFVSHGDVLPILLRLFGEAEYEVHKGDLFWVVGGTVEELNAVQTPSKS